MFIEGTAELSLSEPTTIFLDLRPSAVNITEIKPDPVEETTKVNILFSYAIIKKICNFQQFLDYKLVFRFLVFRFSRDVLVFYTLCIPMIELACNFLSYS